MGINYKIEPIWKRWKRYTINEKTIFFDGFFGGIGFFSVLIIIYFIFYSI